MSGFDDVRSATGDARRAASSMRRGMGFASQPAFVVD
jgi:hypothetical protein